MSKWFVFLKRLKNTDLDQTLFKVYQFERMQIKTFAIGLIDIILINYFCFKFKFAFKTIKIKRILSPKTKFI